MWAAGVRGMIHISCGGEDDTILEASFLKHDGCVHSCFTIQLCVFIIFVQTALFSHSPSSQWCFVPFVFSADFLSAFSFNVNLALQLCLKFWFINFYFGWTLLWFAEKNFWPLAHLCSYSWSFETVLIVRLCSPSAKITKAVMLILWNSLSVAILEIHVVLLKTMEVWPLTSNKDSLLFFLRCQMHLNGTYRHKVEYQINPFL